ncbi:MAG: DUF3617 family protein [Pseudolabrys sp.]
MQKIASCGALAAVVLALVLAAVPARAGIKLDPGTWQQVETGTEDGKPAEPVTDTDCLTPGQARDPIKALSALKDIGSLIGQYCQTMQVHQDDNAVSVDLACGDEKANYVAVKLDFKIHDARHYTGTIKSTFVFKGRKTTSDKAIEAKWLRSKCSKK